MVLPEFWGALGSATVFAIWSLSLFCFSRLYGSVLALVFVSARIFGSARTLGTALASSVLVLSSLSLAVLAGTHFFLPVFVGFRFLSA